MDIALILTKNYSGSEWVLNGDDYAGLEWLSDSPKPSEAELLAQWSDVEYQQQYEVVSEYRRTAYQTISDPLFFGWQRGDNTEQEWLDAVDAVKAEYPYPLKG